MFAGGLFIDLSRMLQWSRDLNLAVEQTNAIGMCDRSPVHGADADDQDKSHQQCKYFFHTSFLVSF